MGRKHRKRDKEIFKNQEVMSYTELTNGVVVKMMVNQTDNSNRLVITEKDSQENGRTSKRVKPIIWFNSGNWRNIPQRVISEFKPNGYYLVAIPWDIRRPQLIDGHIVNGGPCHVLHCVRKEYPKIKFGGKVGPMSSFAPRTTQNGTDIRGYYVGYHWNGEESLDEIPKHFSGKLTLRGRKPIDPKAYKSSTVRRLGVMVGNGGNCVGMEVRHTDREEKQMRNKGEYHHSRPIIIENGFYIFDGIFKWQPIHSNLESPVDLPTEMVSPLIFLGEGIHLITSTKDDNKSEGENYRRKVEICPSVETELVSIVDWDQFEKDFLR